MLSLLKFIYKKLESNGFKVTRCMFFKVHFSIFFSEFVSQF